MATVKYEFSIGALKAFYSIFCPDILLVYISRNAFSENKKNRPPKFHRSVPLNTFTCFHKVQKHSNVKIYKTIPKWSYCMICINTACIFMHSSVVHVVAKSCFSLAKAVATAAFSIVLASKSSKEQLLKRLP